MPSSRSTKRVRWTQRRIHFLTLAYPRGMPVGELLERLNAMPGWPIDNVGQIRTYAVCSLKLRRDPVTWPWIETMNVRRLIVDMNAAHPVATRQRVGQ